ncbi:MAG: methylenetetrahydrofolate reductase [Actinomycetota bacterium]
MTLPELLERARFEVIPMSGASEEVEGSLPIGSVVTVTCSPTKGPDVTMDLAERFAGDGYEVVPHVSARTVRSRDHLLDLLGRMRDAGMTELFVIGGDAVEAAGPYPDAAAVLADLDGAGLSRIGVGGYPEGHPLISDDVLLDSLAEKAGVADYVATQICFSPDAVIRWIERIRARGIKLPVYLGMAGSVKRRKLLEISLRVGVGDSMRYLTKHGNLVTRLMRRSGYTPDEFVSHVEPFIGNADYGIAGFHVFTFNQVDSTERWRRGLVEAYRRAARPLSAEAEDDAAS